MQFLFKPLTILTILWLQVISSGPSNGETNRAQQKPDFKSALSVHRFIVIWLCSMTLYPEHSHGHILSDLFLLLCSVLSFHPRFKISPCFISQEQPCLRFSGSRSSTQIINSFKVCIITHPTFPADFKAVYQQHSTAPVAFSLFCLRVLAPILYWV